MSAAERLASAQHDSVTTRFGKCPTLSRREHDSYHLVYADSILAADPHLAQDIEDGRALRELREALVGHQFAQVYTPYADSDGSGIDPFEVSVIGDDTSRAERGTGNTLAEAADACRQALVKP